MHSQTWNLPPEEIERRSLAIIDSEAGSHGWPAEQWPVVRRMIHTTADFDWQAITIISPEALPRGLAALAAGKAIFTDTRMAMMGISPWRLKRLGCVAHCLINDPQVAEEARHSRTTRAVAAMDLAVARDPEAVFVVGNAPTALLRLLELARAGQARPSLVVGLPVGFVNAVESKAALATSSLPYITASGRKGGSAVAASAVNALAIMALEQQA